MSDTSEDATDRSMANMIALLANAITPLDAHHGYDASGGTVTSLTEAIMGVNAGLVRIADAIAGLKNDAAYKAATNKEIANYIESNFKEKI